jgi:hypothetical protein
LRRQTTARELTLAGSSRQPRLDPFTLPQCFATADARADGGTRLVELHRQGVIVRRAVSGMTMAVNVPLCAFLGVALHLRSAQGKDRGSVAVILEHRDPALSLPLYTANDAMDIIAEWRSWARVLGLPLLVGERNGVLREAFPQLGVLRVWSPTARRRRRNAVQRRRPRLLHRRGVRHGAPEIVHRGEREIIARD